MRAKDYTGTIKNTEQSLFPVSDISNDISIQGTNNLNSISGLKKSTSQTGRKYLKKIYPINNFYPKYTVNSKTHQYENKLPG